MILVIGATGFVGSHLLAELLNRGIKVRATRRSVSNVDPVFKIFDYYGIKPEVSTGLLEWFDADLLNPVDVEAAMEGVEMVYHTAAMVSFDPRDRRKMILNNTRITRNIVNSCLEKDINKLIYVSSTATIGTAPPEEEVTEESPWIDGKQRSAYSLSKHQSEMEVWRGIAEGLDAVIVNPSIILGAGDWNRSSLRLFKAVWDGLKYYMDGVTGYVDVHDVVKSMIDLAQSAITGERYIISSENLSYKEVLQMIAEALKVPPPVRLATPVLMGIAWRLDWLRSKFTRRKRTITREAARVGRNKKYFSSEKIEKTTGIKFIPVSRSIENAAAEFIASYEMN